MVDVARSVRVEVRNPILALDSGKRLAELSPLARAELRGVLLDIRADAQERAEKCWRTHKARWQPTGKPSPSMPVISPGRLTQRTAPMTNLTKAPFKRELSAAEQAGWRFTWDSWPVCPACQTKRLKQHGREEWPVPADYDYQGIKDGAQCVLCGDRHHLQEQEG